MIDLTLTDGLVVIHRDNLDELVDATRKAKLSKADLQATLAARDKELTALRERLWAKRAINPSAGCRKCLAYKVLRLTRQSMLEQEEGIH